MCVFQRKYNTSFLGYNVYHVVCELRIFRWIQLKPYVSRPLFAFVCDVWISVYTENHVPGIFRVVEPNTTHS